MVHSDDVGVIEEVENIGDEIDAESLAKVDALRNARVELEEHGHVEFVAAESANAAERRSNSGDVERLERIGQASCGSAERDTMNVGRSGATTQVGTSLGGAELEASVFARDDIERQAGGNLDERCEGPVAEETLHEGLSGGVGRTLEDAAGDPTMALVVDGVALFILREAAVLGLESGLKVGAVVDGVRPGVAGK